MSRVGKLPINIPNTIKVSISGDVISFDNGKVKKTYQTSPNVKAVFENDQIKLSATDKSIPDASMFVGMNRSNINNIVKGLQTPFKTVLEINGVGYKALVEKRVLVLTLGYSHEIFYALPEGITAVFEKPNLVIITGDNKILVGQVAAELISFRKPEPYKGKGVKYTNEILRRKAGKAAGK